MTINSVGIKHGWEVVEKDCQVRKLDKEDVDKSNVCRTVSLLAE